MRKLRCGVWGLLVMTLVVAAGCEKIVDEFVYPSLGNAKRMSRRELEAIGDQTETLTEQHKLIAPTVADSIGRLKAVFDERLADLQQKTEQEQSLVAVVGERAAQLAVKLGAFPEYTEIESRMTDADQANEQATDEIEALRGDTTELDQRTAIVAKDVDALRAALQQLDQQTVAKLTSVSTQTLKELAALKGDSKAFREKLAAELQLTRSSMDAMKGLSTQEIMALLAAALSAAAAGGALGKTGKSRGSIEIEKLKEKLDAVTTDIALVKPSPIAADLVAHGTKTP